MYSTGQGRRSSGSGDGLFNFFAFLAIFLTSLALVLRIVGLFI